MGILLLAGVLLGFGSWESMGPGGTSTTVVCTAHTAEQDVLFAGCFYYSGWQECRRSFDNGETWELCASPDFAVTCLCADSYGRLFMGGEGFVMISSDLGETWQTVPTSPGALIENVTADPGDSMHLLAAVTSCERPLLQSYDGGTSWSPVSSSPLSTWGSTVSFATDNPDVVYFAGYPQDRSYDLVVQRSLDGGNSWTDITPETPGSMGTGPYIDLVVSPEDQNMVCLNAGTWIFCTDDGGSSWSLRLTTTFIIKDLALTDTPGAVYAASINKFYKSFDFGYTWQMSSEFPSYAQSLTVTDCGGERVHAGCVSGHYYADSPGGEWTFANTGIPGGRVYSLLENETDDSGFPVCTGFDFLNEDPYSVDPCGDLPFECVSYVARSYCDPEVFFAVGDAG